jgi:hypothetical protein
MGSRYGWVAALVLTLALVCASAATARAQPPKPVPTHEPSHEPPLIYASKLVMRDNTDPLEPRVQDALSRNFEQIKDGSFESYWGMDDKLHDIGFQLQSLSRYAQKSYDRFRSAEFLALRSHRITDVLRVEVYRPAPQQQGGAVTIDSALGPSRTSRAVRSSPTSRCHRSG